jgi:hypothetical protein
MIGAWESGIWVTRAAKDYDGWMASGRTTIRALQEGIKRFRDAGGGRAMVATLVKSTPFSRAGGGHPSMDGAVAVS